MRVEAADSVVGGGGGGEVGCVEDVDGAVAGEFLADVVVWDYLGCCDLD